jgi:cytochrome c oxidase cbb3-type subunit 3
MGVAPLLILGALASCSNEAREVAPGIPQTAPTGNTDPRISAYQANLYQISQGSRYFYWYGCVACHSGTAPSATSFTGERWQRGGGFADVYQSIAAHRPKPAYGDVIPLEQLWQVTAYVRDLAKHYPQKRRRVSLDQKGEAQGPRWPGPQ